MSRDEDTPAHIIPTLPVLSGELCFSDYPVYELPDSSDQSSLATTSHGACSTIAVCPEDSHVDEGAVIVTAALLAHIAVLQATNKCLQDVIDKQQPRCFGLENIRHDDKCVHFYTGISII